MKAFFSGLIFSIPVALICLIVLQGKGTEPGVWVIIGIVFLLGIPWNLVVGVIVVVVLTIIDKSIAVGMLPLMWGIVGALVIGAHINGIFLIKKFAKN